MEISAPAVLSVLDQADRQEDLPTWSRAFEGGLTQLMAGLDSALIRVHDGGEGVELLLPDERPALQAVLSAGHGSLGERDRERLYRRGPTAVALSELFPRGTPQRALEARMSRLEVGDIVGLVPEPDLSVMVLTKRVQRFDSRQRQLLLALAQHAAVSVALRDVEGVPCLDDDLPVRLRGALAELDARREGVGGGATDAKCALAFLTRLAEEGFAVVREERRGRRHRLIAVRVRDPGARSLRTLDAGERRVLHGFRQGLSPQEIAYELGVAEGTIAGRVRRIRAKLGIDPRSPLVSAAAASGR